MNELSVTGTSVILSLESQLETEGFDCEFVRVKGTSVGGECNQPKTGISTLHSSRFSAGNLEKNKTLLSYEMFHRYETIN